MRVEVQILARDRGDLRVHGGEVRVIEEVESSRLFIYEVTFYQSLTLWKTLARWQQQYRFTSLP
jgi:hypothetical protein